MAATRTGGHRGGNIIRHLVVGEGAGQRLRARIPMAGRWDLLEWSTIAASQLAVATVASRRRPERESFGPGLVVGLAWYATVAAPHLHTTLFDPPDHPWRWVALLATFIGIIVVTSLDPARRIHRGKVHR